MKRTLSAIIFILLMSFFVIIDNISAKKQTIHFVSEFFPPYQYLKKGKVVGSVVDEIYKIARCANIKAKIFLLPWVRAYYTALSREDTVIFSIAKTKKRIDEFIWIGPLIPLEPVIYKLKSRKDIQLNSLTDLRHYSIGLQRGDFTIGLLLNKKYIENKNVILISAKES